MMIAHTASAQPLNQFPLVLVVTEEAITISIKDELHAMTERLHAEDAAEVLSNARWLLSEKQVASLEGLPAMWRRGTNDQAHG